MFHLTFSNRFEVLLDTLLDRLGAEGGDPFTAQQVIVPGMGVQRRVELALADRQGICANVRFSYLAQWLWTQIGHVAPVQEVSPFSPGLLTWRIYEALGDTGFTAAHGRLTRYLAAADAAMRLELAQHIARLVEQTITYRPQWLAAWSEGRRAGIPGLDAAGAEDEAWQSELWRRITAELGTSREHPSVALFRQVDALGDEAPRSAGLPASAHVFCLPALPPLYLDILRRLGRGMRIDLYLLNPCREFWFDIVDPKRLSYLDARCRRDYHEVGNSLLASWGKQTQAQIELLLDHDDGIVEEGSRFQASADDTLLGRLQDAMLDLAELQGASITPGAGDRSIEVHVCHSLTRELEVLQDRLLALFAGPRPPTPDRILVVTPDLDSAAPLIDAVFGNAPPDRRILYRITGLGQRHVNPVARVLDAILGLGTARHGASAVFDLLQQAPVAQRFDLSPQDLSVVRDWIRQTGVRWGLDAAERRDLDLPPDERHSFRDGLHRLYLAYALGNTGARIAGRIGYADPEGQGALPLGRLWRYVEVLDRLRREWRQPRSAQGWRDALLDALDALVAPAAQWIDDLKTVRAAIAEMEGNMRGGGLRSPVPLEVVRSTLVELLDDAARGAVPTGAVTFTAMSGLRGLPYTVVCAVGMNDGAFPSVQRPAEFDLMARHPLRGDRQRAHDERNLFLDLLLAAREYFHLSYTGRSIRDNSAQPPSVLVDELLDYLVRACSGDAADRQAARRRLVVEHPLQAFSADYFLPPGEAADPRLRSFNAEYCAALQAQFAAVPTALPCVQDDDDGDAQRPGLPFFTAQLPAPGAESRSLTLERLIRFFANPCRYLMRERIGIVLPEHAAELLEVEPFLPDWPGRQALAERLLPLALAGGTQVELLEHARAGNEYPAGNLGDAALAGEIAALRSFAAGLATDLAAPTRPPRGALLGFEVEGERWTLEGAMADLRPDGVVGWRYDEVRARDYLTGWIKHLFACALLSEQPSLVDEASTPSTVAATTRWHSRDGVYRLQPAGGARAHLAALLALYRQGLCAPLPFFPKSAWKYVVSGGNLGQARAVWASTRDRPWGEDGDPAYRLALRGTSDPLDARFMQVARVVFEPLLAHLEDPRL